MSRKLLEPNSNFIAGSALRLSPHSDVVFHLCDHRYAGMYLSVGGITSTFVAHARDYYFFSSIPSEQLSRGYDCRIVLTKVHRHGVSSVGV